MLLSGGSIYTPTIINHSDLLNSGVNSHDQIDVFINSKAANNGLAPLNGTGKIPLVHLPTSGQNFKGLWNAQTNTPPLLTGGIGGVLGDYYIVNVAGTSLIDGINSWGIGDWIINTSGKWEKIDQPDPELVDIGAEYKTVQDKPIKNNSIPTDPKHLVQKDYVDTSILNNNNILNTRFLNLENKDNTHDTRLDGQDTLINNLISSQVLVDNNQNAAISNLQTSQASQDTNLQTLNQKTNILDTQGRLTNNLLLDNDNSYDIGDTGNRVRSIYAIGSVNATLMKAVGFINPVNNLGISIDQIGSVTLDSYNSAVNDRALSLDLNGKIQKTDATITATGNIGGVNINASNDMSCVNLSANQALRSNDWFNLTNNAGINIAPTISGTTLFRGTDYADGNIERALIMDGVGTLQKTAATISATGNIGGVNITASNRLKANDLYNLSNTANINIGDDLLGVVKLRGSAYNEGTVNKAAMIDFDGSIVKTNVVINNADIDCKDISCQKIIGVSPGPNSDLELLNQGGKGILIKDEAKTAEANICFTNDYYKSNTNKYLKISNQGLLIADIPAGGVINGITSTENPVASGQYDISFPSTQYQVSGTLKIDINGKIYVVPDPVLLVSPHNLTSNNDPNFILSAQWGAPTDIYKAFDGLFGAGSNGTLFTGGSTYDPNNGNAILNSFKGILGSWIKVSLNQSKIFNSFRFAAGGFANGQNPTSFILYGSNDDVENNYTAFYSVNNYTFINTPNYEPIITFTQQTWRYIVFQCIQIGNGNPLGQNGATLSELDFLNN